jgi:hypothetical protein
VPKARLSFGDAASSLAVFNGFPSFLLGGGWNVVVGGFKGLGASKNGCNNLVRVEQREAERLRGKTWEIATCVGRKCVGRGRQRR